MNIVWIFRTEQEFCSNIGIGTISSIHFHSVVITHWTENFILNVLLTCDACQVITISILFEAFELLEHETWWLRGYQVVLAWTKSFAYIINGNELIKLFYFSEQRKWDLCYCLTKRDTTSIEG